MTKDVIETGMYSTLTFRSKRKVWPKVTIPVQPRLGYQALCRALAKSGANTTDKNFFISLNLLCEFLDEESSRNDP